jgi:hypothetical protein
MSELERALRESLRNWLLTPEERQRLAAPAEALTLTLEPPSDAEFDPTDPDNWKSLDYIEGVVQNKIDKQNDLWDVIDGRLRLILGVIGIVFAAVLGFQRGPSQLDFLVAFMAVISVLLFLAAAIAAAIVYWPMDFIWPPNPQALRDDYLTTDVRDTKLDVIDRIVYRYNTNGLAIERKVTGFRIAFTLSAMAILALAVALVVHIISQAKTLNCDGWPGLLGHGCSWFQQTLGPWLGGSS